MSGAVTGAKSSLFDVHDVTAPRELDSVTYPAGTTPQAELDPRQFTWLPDRRTALTVISGGYDGRVGYVSVLTVEESTMTDRLVPLEGLVSITGVRLVPLPDGRVVLVSGDAVKSFAL
jgi:hypothetical protein